ncbi:hypothetical protein ACS5PU_12225 [Pedobacter sp. GSP4]|uniref:hypothetical protein n=1 Tax=Pedobacter sp. GSP4 TaxID=3453716 RepID=UPI003EEC1651
MEKCKWFFLLLFFCGICSCKKGMDLQNVISVENVYIEFVTSNQVNINYKLSQLGYEETGVVFYKKNDPVATNTVKAIRENGLLKLSLQKLEPGTEYAFKVFYKLNGEQKVAAKEYTVKTLSEELSKFALQIKSTSIDYDDQGNFTIDIEGENLQNLNLSQLEIKVNLNPVTIAYPVLIAGSRYKLTIKGIVRTVNANYAVQGLYQGKEIFFQSIPFAFHGDRYWISFQPTNLRGYFASVFENELYYFFDKQVSKWNDAAQRFTVLGAIPDNTINTLNSNATGTSFDGQLFFPPTDKTYFPNPADFSVAYKYPEAYSYNPGTSKWTSYSFKAQNSSGSSRIVKNSHYLIHNGDLYMAFSLVDEQTSNPNLVIKTDNFIYRYNRQSKQFESATNLDIKILYFNFISVNNKMYLTGLVPVSDNGFNLSATFAVFKVEDNFALKEIYWGGTVAQPLTFIPKNVVVYDQKILVTASLDDFKLFDPIDQKLYQVYLKSNLPNVYLNGFFNYNNKLHINTDLGFTSSKIYEVSIAKGR